MAARRYQATWDDVASLNCEYIAAWGAFAGYVGPIDFEGFKPDKIHAEHDAQRDVFSVFYVWPGKDDESGPVRSSVLLRRRSCRFGGTRPYFVCPSCSRTTLRLAVMPGGLRCGACARITWASRRETVNRRLVRKANKVASRLGLDHFADLPTRPLHMRGSTYARIRTELEPLKAEINRRLALRAARSRGGIGAWTAALRWGL